MATVVEVEYFNSYWMKSIMDYQSYSSTDNDGGVGTPKAQSGGSGSGGELGTWPLTNVYSNPTSRSISKEFGTAAGANPEIEVDQSIAPINWYVEESRIKGGYNDMPTDLGARAYADEDEPIQQHRFNALIYSGLFNSRTGVNRTNEFPVGEQITKAANPEYGSIQKLYAEENNLLVLQENKCQRALIDKDAIFSAEGGGTVTTSNNVIGTITPYAGEYGISFNPESFAIYGFRKYFADRNRSAILRLSHDGITEISEYGMRDWFRDNLGVLNDQISNTYTLELVVSWGTATQNFSKLECTDVSLYGLTIGSELFIDTGGGFLTTNAFVTEIDTTSGKIFLNKSITVSATVSTTVHFVNYYRSRINSGWDIYNKQYVCSLQLNSSTRGTTPNKDNTYYTLGFDEVTNGWTSFYTYRFSQLGSIKSLVYTTNSASSSFTTTGVGNFGLWLQYSENVSRGSFMGTSNPSTVTFIANPNPSVYKNFLTINYEGNSGWKVVSIESDETGFDPEWSAGSPLGTWKLYYDNTNAVYSYYEGQYDGAGNTGATASPTNPPLLHAGFDRKENRYVANLVNAGNDTNAWPGEVIYGGEVSGIKGFYATVKMSTDSSTDPGGYKELYTVGTNYTIASM